MKAIKILLGLMVAFAAINLASCGRGDSPVREYVEILDQAADKADKISSMEELMNVHAIISPEDAMQIMKENADYKLSKSDKEMLKKSYGRLLRIAYKKTAEYGDLPEGLKRQFEGQIDLFIEAANKSIDSATTFGQLNGIQ